jgi:hypothetical protein
MKRDFIDSRSPTPKEDAILACIVLGIFVALITGIIICWHFAPAIDAWKGL